MWVFQFYALRAAYYTAIHWWVGLKWVGLNLGVARTGHVIVGARTLAEDEVFRCAPLPGAGLSGQEHDSRAAA